MAFTKPARVNISTAVFADDGNMGLWTELVSSLTSVAGQVYGAKTQKDIAAKQLAHDTSIATMQEDTKRLQLAIQAKQAELLAANSGPSMLSVRGIGKAVSSPVGIAAIAGGSIAIGLLIYLLLKKKKRR